jgi:hypothetical protein
MTGVDRPYPVGSDHPEAGRIVADQMIASAAIDGFGSASLGGSHRLYELLRHPGALLIDGSPDSRWSEAASAYAARVNLVAATPGTESLLIRPDGIVAWGALKDADPADATTLESQLRAALTQWFGPPATA